ncbi:DUF2357 domain-containing protein [Puniceicoccus vermicola]|uniref:DUF2357 domain-containing protein n=1 Tax=Puniceicoccus vermicola TaxID=388746 RepID=A0A7X1B2H9_9BACT|nr:DUF2357 domain-containing protein [Puniceicoccus vermicola]MBC2604239.1 DUF2357 domain-containing protein [Puniceicoccus vermicola]
MENGFQRLAIPLRRIDGSAAGWWVIEPSTSQVSLDPDKCETTGNSLPPTWKGLKEAEDNNSAVAPIEISTRAGITCIRLLETHGYEWSVEEAPNDMALQLSSSLKGTRFWKEKRGQSGSFKVVNHLGLADFKLEGTDIQALDLQFEFVSRKFDFDSEYRRLTEDIADFCQQLLLSWDAPTRLRFNVDPNEAHKLLLEQFLFLKSFMTQDRLSRLLEAIGRNPHSTLIKESEWVPAAAARSNDYMWDPCRMLRDWRQNNGKRVPGEVMDIRKSDTHDTAPNRFIKFALAQFRQICSDVCAQRWTENNKTSTLGMEAKEMLDQIDGLLSRRFFNEVGRMQRLPLDNQTLQKREGYREVLQAWLLTQAATSLNWEGERDCYEGATRDVATLYEYWIFIQLHQILSSIPGLAPDGEDFGPGRFISESDGQLTINLKQGCYSRSSYIWIGTGTTLKVDLQYERSFSSSSSATQSGSYSRTFRPDYTISIFPASFESEKQAEAAGKVAHLHLDAKYRAEDISAVFGRKEISEEEISDEKLESKSERSYRRGDLLKMHTYNDALRHTIGSYVLYPGTKTEAAEKMPKFHEIAPGVGAMVMKPENLDCLDAIRQFFLEVFNHQADLFSQYRYLSDTNHQTYSDAPECVEQFGSKYNIARKNAPCVVLWLRKDQEPIFKKHGFAYCRAISEEHKRTLNLNLSIEVGSEFIPCGGGQGATKLGYCWRAKVKTARFISKEQLKTYIKERGLSDQLEPRSVDHYLLFEFAEATDFKEIDLTDIYRSKQSGSKYMAVTCQWIDILKSIEKTELNLAADS